MSLISSLHQGFSQQMREILESDVLAGARALLGATLVHGDLRARIVETEAYRTPDDRGCHAHRGQTHRNRAMFGEPGFAYIYFTYGNHWMLNVTAHPAANAAAVLIRAAQPLQGLDSMRQRRQQTDDRALLSGPGKLAQAFGIDERQYAFDLFDPASPLRIEPGEAVSSVLIGPRIGISAGNGDTQPWRFVDASGLQWCSRPLKGLIQL